MTCRKGLTVFLSCFIVCFIGSVAVACHRCDSAVACLKRQYLADNRALGDAYRAELAEIHAARQSALKQLAQDRRLANQLCATDKKYAIKEIRDERRATIECASRDLAEAGRRYRAVRAETRTSYLRAVAQVQCSAKYRRSSVVVVSWPSWGAPAGATLPPIPPQSVPPQSIPPQSVPPESIQLQPTPMFELPPDQGPIEILPEGMSRPKAVGPLIEDQTSQNVEVDWVQQVTQLLRQRVAFRRSLALSSAYLE